MAVKKYKAGKILNKVLKLIAGIYFKHLFDYSMEVEQLQGIKTPYIVLANHTNFWDPFLLSMCIPVPVYFLTSDAYFRNPILKQLLKLVGAIPKTKLVSDPLSIRAILGVVKRNGVIGIFPEGSRNWDGRTLPLLHPTAKLIKHLGIPVVTVVFKGACLSMPRWASSVRKGHLSMVISQVLDANETKLLSSDEIFSRISESLSYDEYDYQREHMYPYKGQNMAERLELFLFACPGCRSTDKLTSARETLCCSNCGYQVSYNAYGFFRTSGQKLYFDNPRDWNNWQLNYLDAMITSQAASGSLLPLLQEHNIKMRIGQRTGSLKTRVTDGTLSIYPGRLEYSIAAKLILSFNIEEISGENVQFNNQLELICKKILYRFSVKDGNMSAYKWVNAIEILKRLYRQSTPSAKIKVKTKNTLEGNI